MILNNFEKAKNKKTFAIKYNTLTLTDELAYF